MRPISIGELMQFCCTNQLCDRDDHGTLREPLSITAGCHPEAPVKLSFSRDKGVMSIHCSACGELGGLLQLMTVSSVLVD